MKPPWSKNVAEKQDAAIQKRATNETRLPISEYPYYIGINNNRSVIEWIERLLTKR